MASTTLALSPPFAGEGAWVQVEKITPSDADEPGCCGNPSHAFVNFGSSLSVDGETLVVGTAFDSHSDPDWAYVFERDAAGFKQVAKLVPLQPERSAGFGESVDLDEDAGVAIVGDPGYDAPGEEDAGAVHVFRRAADGSWEREARLIGPVDGDENDHHSDASVGPNFGDSVAIDQDTLAVGTPRDNPNGRYSGTVFVYERVDGDWTLAARLEGEGEDDHFGLPLDLEGGTLAATSFQEGTESGPATGAVHLFEASDDGWVETAVLAPPDNGGGAFGFPVKLSEDGDTIIASAIWNENWNGIDLQPVPFMGETANTGSVYIYSRNGDEWTLDADLSSPAPLHRQRFGQDVALSEDGKTAFVGSNHHPTDVRAGTVHHYEKTPTGWIHVQRLLSNDLSPGDYLGHRVSLSDATLVVSAPFDTNHGDAPFPLDDTRWIPTMDDGQVHFNNGVAAGSVYVFEPIGEAASAVDN